MHPLKTEITAVTDRSALRDRWTALEARSNCAFFLSWQWIGTWLESLDAAPLLLSVTAQDGRDIGLGLFVQAVETRQKVLRVRQLRLHDTGIRSRDAVTIEFNTLLTETGMESAAWQSALTALHDPGAPRWDELIVSGATDETAQILGTQGLGLHRRAATTSAHVDLAGLRVNGVNDRDGYIASLGKNTRSQIRRAVRLYEEHGPLTLTPCTDIDAFFLELGEHHEAKWREAGIDGATANADYMTFHRAMIGTALPRGGVEMLRASAGDYAFGWLYNFVHRGAVLFYLSGFRAEQDNRLKPGLVTHALAVERHLQAGAHVYDFMGGTNRYKSSLGQPGPDIVSLALQKRVPKLMLENMARQIRTRLSRRAEASSNT